jgi:hypothetical protein
MLLGATGGDGCCPRASGAPGDRDPVLRQRLRPRRLAAAHPGHRDLARPVGCRAKLGLALLAIAGGAVASLPVAGALTARYGSRPTPRAAALLFCAGAAALPGSCPAARRRVQRRWPPVRPRARDRHRRGLDRWLLRIPGRPAADRPGRRGKRSAGRAWPGRRHGRAHERCRPAPRRSAGAGACRGSSHGPVGRAPRSGAHTVWPEARRSTSTGTPYAASRRAAVSTASGEPCARRPPSCSSATSLAQAKA